MARIVEGQPTFTEIEGLKAAGADVTDIVEDIFPGRESRSRRRVFARLHRADAKTPTPKMITKELSVEGGYVISIRKPAISGRIARERILLRDSLGFSPEDIGYGESSSDGQEGEAKKASEAINHTNGNGHRYGAEIEDMLNSSIKGKLNSFKGSLKLVSP